jgi:hypothetical protein
MSASNSSLIMPLRNVGIKFLPYNAPSQCQHQSPTVIYALRRKKKNFIFAVGRGTVCFCSEWAVRCKTPAHCRGSRFLFCAGDAYTWIALDCRRICFIWQMNVVAYEPVSMYRGKAWVLCPLNSLPFVVLWRSFIQRRCSEGTTVDTGAWSFLTRSSEHSLFNSALNISLEFMILYICILSHIATSLSLFFPSFVRLIDVFNKY